MVFSADRDAVVVIEAGAFVRAAEVVRAGEFRGYGATRVLAPTISLDDFVAKDAVGFRETRLVPSWFEGGFHTISYIS